MVVDIAITETITKKAKTTAKAARISSWGMSYFVPVFPTCVKSSTGVTAQRIFWNRPSKIGAFRSKSPNDPRFKCGLARSRTMSKSVLSCGFGSNTSVAAMPYQLSRF